MGPAIMHRTARSLTSMLLTLLAFAAAIAALSNPPQPGAESSMAPAVVAQSTSAILEDRSA